MDKRKELRLLQEIEDSQEPIFGLLPDYKTYDDDLQLIENPFNKSTNQFKWSKDEFEAMIKYTELENPSHGKYLKPLLPHVEHEGKIVFEYGPLKEYGLKRENFKFII